MKISCIQLNMKPAKPDYNFVLAKEEIEKAMEEKPDCIVLPETWNTGFFPRENLMQLCDTEGRRTKEEIGALARKFSVNIVAGSLANIKDGKVYNTSYVFNRDGVPIAQYDKTHLFTPMKEHHFFTEGDALCKFKLDGKSCAVIICYDIRFPELSRSLAIDGLDILFIVSQWPAVRIAHLTALIKARAIENQMFTVCCNSCGTMNDTVYGGASSICNPLGEFICTAGSEQETITADCNTDILASIRESINIFTDRRPELYKAIIEKEGL